MSIWNIMRGHFSVSWKEAIAQLIWGGLIVLMLLAVDWYALDHGEYRYYAILVCGFALGFGIYLTKKIYVELNEAKDNVRVAGEKIFAEFFGAFALCAFLISQYKAGIDLDRYSFSSRSEHLARAAAVIKTIYPVQDCADATTCPEGLGKLFRRAHDALNDESQTRLESDIEQIKILVGSISAIKGNEKKMAAIVTNLDSAALSTRILTLWTAATLPLLMLFATLAISRKLALALFEGRTRLREKQEKLDLAESRKAGF
jgi:hypothetical protein